MKTADRPYSMIEKDFEPLSLESRSFSIHGVGVSVVSNTPAILEPVSEMLSYFEKGREAGEDAVRFYLLEESPGKLPHLEEIHREGRVIFDSDDSRQQSAIKEVGVGFKYLQWRGFYLADFGPAGAMVLDIEKGLCVCFLPEPSSLHPGMISNYIFLIGLAELLRSKDLFLIHCAALSLDGRCVLAPGFSGSGKTTLALALLRGGFKYLSDDRPFLKEEPGGLKILAFPEVLDVTEETISGFPEVAGLPEKAFTRGIRKRRFRVEELYPESIVESSTPRALVVLNIVDEDRSRLRHLKKVEAVERLLPHSLVVIEEETARRQFHLLCELVERVDCYRLDFGRDLLDVHGLIREIL